MMDFLEWCGRHWFLALIALMCLSQMLLTGLTRTYRVIMVSVRGWPPSHLDADGDWKPNPEPAEGAQS